MPKKDVRQAAERERKLTKVAAEVSWIDKVLASGPNTLEDVLENKEEDSVPSKGLNNLYGSRTLHQSSILY